MSIVESVIALHHLESLAETDVGNPCLAAWFPKHSLAKRYGYVHRQQSQLTFVGAAIFFNLLLRTFHLVKKGVHDQFATKWMDLSVDFMTIPREVNPGGEVSTVSVTLRGVVTAFKRSYLRTCLFFRKIFSSCQTSAPRKTCRLRAVQWESWS